MKTVMMSGIFVASMALGGCASTGSSSPKTDAQGYPVLEVLSSTPYVWDDNISEALNVARMAQPARVGQGMRDFTDGTQAGVAGRSSTGERVAGGAIMGVGQGLFGVVASEMMIGRVDREVSWGPAIVELIESNDMPDFRAVQQRISGKIIDALKSEFNDFELRAVLTPKHTQTLARRTTIITFDTDACADAIRFDSLDTENAPERLSLGVLDNFLEGASNFSGVCSIAFDLSWAGLLKRNGADYQVFVAEMRTDSRTASSFFNGALMRSYGGYFLIPDQYTFIAHDGRTGERKIVRMGYARVMSSGDELLFQRP